MDRSSPRHLEDSAATWPVESTSDLFRDDWVMALRADLVRHPDDPDAEPFRRLVLEHPGAAVVLALDAEDRVHCLRQYRHPAGRRLVELPAGLCDEPGDEPLDVARRELREEAGLEAREWAHLASTYSSPGISAELMHFFVARDLVVMEDRGFDPTHEEADMDAFWVPFGDLHRAVLDGRVADGPVVIAVLMAAARQMAGSMPGTPRGE